MASVSVAQSISSGTLRTHHGIVFTTPNCALIAFDFYKLELDFIQTMGMIILSILYGGRRWRRRTEVVVVNTGHPGGYGGGSGLNGVNVGPNHHVHVVQGVQSSQSSEDLAEEDMDPLVWSRTDGDVAYTY